MEMVGRGWAGCLEPSRGGAGTHPAAGSTASGYITSPSEAGQGAGAPAPGSWNRPATVLAAACVPSCLPAARGRPRRARAWLHFSASLPGRSSPEWVDWAHRQVLLRLMSGTGGPEARGL